MPSFDIVCELDRHEVANAVDQANREVTTRFDFKGVAAKYTYEDKTIILQAEADFQLQQMLDILRHKFTKRRIDLAHMQIDAPIVQHKNARQTINLLEGIAQDVAKNIVKLIKQQKIKVQAAVQGEHIRVTGKKRDDLQAVITFLKEQELNTPLEFKNFRD